jgi:hypothetical protein
MAYIPTKEPPISPETTLGNARTWLNIIRYREYGTVIQLQDDSPYRVADIIGDPKMLKKFLGPYYRKYLLIYTALDQGELIPTVKSALLDAVRERKVLKPDEAEKLSINDLLAKIGDKGFEVGFFIGGIATLLNSGNFNPLFDLEHILEKSKNLSVILFSETDITHEKYHVLTIKSSLLFDHVIKYPMYGEADCRQFIRYNNSMWHTKLPADQEKEIIRLSGGYLWLISDLQRFLRDHPDKNISRAIEDFVLLQKLETIWTKFSESEKNILRMTDRGALTVEDKSSHEFRHLLDMRILLKSGKQFILGLPLLARVIDREKKIDGLKVVKDRIYAEDKDITNNFSSAESKFLSLVLTRKREIIPRDEVAKFLWGEAWEDKYSDWAIDRLAYRLRIKMKSLGADPDLLKTAKRKGFIFA